MNFVRFRPISLPAHLLERAGHVSIVAGLGAAIWAPSWSPVFGVMGLGLAVFPICSSLTWSRGTQLRPALIWALVSMLIGVGSQVMALSEPSVFGRPMTGQLVYAMVLTALAALISVLNARRPGGGPWALLMSLLVLVMFTPWFEGSGLVRSGGAWDRLRLDSPWSVFYGLLVLAGGTNHLPTKFAPASLALLAAFGLEFLALTRQDWSREMRGQCWSAVPLLLGEAVWLATWRARVQVQAGSDLEQLWIWFRDHWGVAWALRVQERFGKTAKGARWPIVLTWHGLESPEGRPLRDEVPASAFATLQALLRRFAEPERLACEARAGCELRRGATKSSQSGVEAAQGTGGEE